MLSNVLERRIARPKLTHEEVLLISAVQRLAHESIAPRAAEYDRTAAFPWENIREINELGLNGVFIPEQYGGSPLSYLCYLECVLELSRACASTGITWATNFHAMKPVIDFGNEQQKSRFLPRMTEGGLASLAITEPDAGSDARGMKTTFSAAGDSIVIRGSKCFITNGDVADLLLLFGKWDGPGAAKDAISVLILEKGTSGLRWLRNEDKLGTRASSTSALSFDDCRVPLTNLLGQPGDGLKILFGSLNKSRPSIAAHALGITRAALDDGIEYLNQRRQSGRRLLEFQGMQFMLADLVAEYILCESFLWRLGEGVDAGATEFGTEASILKLRASDLAMRATTDLVQMYGGYGYCRGYRAERLMRDAKITQIWEGTNQIHRQLIGRSFLSK